MGEILIDTNVLLTAAKGFDLYGELEGYPHLQPTTVEQVFEELEALTEKDSLKSRQDASVALQVARQHLNTVPRSAGYADDALLNAAKQRKAHIATLDRDLKRRARKLGIPVLTIKGRKRLAPAW